MNFKLAVIHSEIDRAILRQALDEDRIQPLGTSAPLTAADIDAAHRVVGMMGPEPYLEALRQGAQVILGGRGTDPSPWVALAKHLGIPDGPAWYAGKLLECACNAALPKKHDCLIATITPDYVEVEPANEELACSPLSVSIQALHETASPIYRYEPGGLMDTSHCKMEAVTPRRVRISGMQWQPQPYTIKLEGVRRVGFSCMTVAATRDPGLIGQLDDFLQDAEAAAHTKIQALGISRDRYRLVYRAYGRDGVMGKLEPLKDTTSHEICIVAEAVADTQEIANSALALARVTLLHMDFPGRLCREGNMAFPFSPSDVERGEVFEFSMNHVIQPASPLELFPIEYEDV